MLGLLLAATPAAAVQINGSDGATSIFTPVATSDANVDLTALTVGSGFTSQAYGLRYWNFSFTGAMTAGRTVTLSGDEGQYGVCNDTTGGFDLTFDAGGATVDVAPGDCMNLVVDDSGDVVQVAGYGSAAALGLGSMADQDATAVAITGGSVTGITDITVADGGTGRSTSTTAYGLIAAGTTATGALQTLPAGATTGILVGGGASALPVWTTATGTGAPVRATAPTIAGLVTTGDIAMASASSISFNAGNALITHVAATSTITISKLGIGSDTTADTAFIVYKDGSSGGGSAAFFVRQDGTDPIFFLAGAGGAQRGFFTNGVVIGTSGADQGVGTLNLETALYLADSVVVSSARHLRLRGYTVATLPACTQGDTAFVTDASSPTYLGALTGSSSTVAPVFCNATNTWVSG